MIFNLLRRDPMRPAVNRLHATLVAAARNPVLYARFGVPDTLEGRFECIVLHVALVQRRLSGLGPEGVHAAQLLADQTFAELDSAMREIGVSDLGVPRKMKTLAGAYLGRAAAYDAMLAPDGDVQATLGRNLYGAEIAGAHAAGLRAMAAYVTALAAALSGMDLATILSLQPQALARLAGDGEAG